MKQPQHVCTGPWNNAPTLSWFAAWRDTVDARNIDAFQLFYLYIYYICIYTQQQQHWSVQPDLPRQKWCHLLFNSWSEIAASKGKKDAHKSMVPGLCIYIYTHYIHWTYLLFFLKKKIYIYIYTLLLYCMCLLYIIKHIYIY